MPEVCLVAIKNTNHTCGRLTIPYTMCGSSKSFFVRATQDHVNLRSLINPADLVTASQGVFTSDTRARRLLDQFTINEFVYHTMGAVRATPHIEAAAEQHGWQTRTNIKVHTAVPSNLLEDSKEDLIPLVRFHGGGGVSEKCLI